MQNILRKRLVAWLAGGALASIGIGLGASAPYAQEREQQQPQRESQRQQQAQQLGQPGKRLVGSLASFHNHQIEIAEMAQKQGQSEQVKSFAKRVAQTHEQASQRLDQLAQELNVDVEQLREQEENRAQAQRQPQQQQPQQQQPQQQQPQQQQPQQQGQPQGRNGQETKQPSTLKEAMAEERALLEQANQQDTFDQVYLSAAGQAHQKWSQKLQRIEGQIQNQQLKQHVSTLRPQLQQIAQEARQMQKEVAVR